MKKVPFMFRLLSDSHAGLDRDHVGTVLQAAQVCFERRQSYVRHAVACMDKQSEGKGKDQTPHSPVPYLSRQRRRLN